MQYVPGVCNIGKSEIVRREYAASIAGIANYEPVNINRALNITFGERFFNLAELKTNTPMNILREILPSISLVLLNKII